MPPDVFLKPWDLKDDVVYGPFQTRRQGKSLGINLLASMRKHCTFNCVYCQCGWTREPVPARLDAVAAYPSLEHVRTAIEGRFEELHDQGDVPDAIILSGNGEPTLYPRIEEAVDVILEMRGRFFPEARAGVLTAGTELGREAVRRAIDRLDHRMVKLDAGSNRMLRRVNLPRVAFDLDRLVVWTRLLRDCIVQSCFVRGPIDNTAEVDIDNWIERVRSIRPTCVHVYSLDRRPPTRGLQMVDRASLEWIASRLLSETGIEAKVY